MRRAVVWLFLLLWTPGIYLTRWPAAAAQSSADLPPADTVVKPRAYVSLKPVPRGRTFEVAVVAKILPGFHINASKVLQDYLIPTTLEADLPRGFRRLETAYPPGQLRKFAFSPQKLAVYDGTVTLRMRIEVALDAPLGARPLPLALRYQACNDKVCLPPVQLPVAVGLEVAPAGARAWPAHPAIFRERAPHPKTQAPA